MNGGRMLSLRAACKSGSSTVFLFLTGYTGLYVVRMPNNHRRRQEVVL